jgi:hypothetical protein
MNMIAALLIALIVLGLPTLYFAWRSREFRKFLAGAFFVSAGIQFYLCLAKVSVPLLGTNLVLTPEISGGALHRSFHLVRALPLLWFYQAAERLRQVTERLFVRNQHDYDTTHPCPFCYRASSIFGARQACGTTKG